MITITGANGFVGSFLTSYLLKRGATVHPLVRSARFPNQIECGPIENVPDWRRFLSNTDVVIHAAARVHQMKDDPKRAVTETDEVNHISTIRLAKDAAAVGVKRFVFLSSIKVLGEATAAGMKFNAVATASPQDPYARSKWAAEEGLRKLATETGLEVVIVRPPLVYGPGVKGNFLQLMKLVKRGIPLPIGCISNKRSLVSVNNLCDLLAVCCKHPAAANQTFLVSDDHDLSTPDLVREIARAMDRSARLLPVPTYALSWLGKLTGKTEQISRLTESLEVDITATKATLGWVPPASVTEGIRETVAAFLKG